MSTLIVKNIQHEGPGTIEDFLKEQGREYHVINLSDCREEIPDIRQYSHLVVMGGPMAVYEIDDHPHMHFETAMIRTFIKRRSHVLGICLGAQMIAHALGARVYKGEKVEIGWDMVQITDEGMKDDCFSVLAVDTARYAKVFQWHGDTFDLPDNAICLAEADYYKNQAFVYRDNVYALQFHVEVTPDMIKEWFQEENIIDFDNMMEQTYKIYPEYRARAMRFYEKFFS